MEKALFNYFDINHDGSITLDEIEKVMNTFKNDLESEMEMPNMDQIKIAFEKYDENRNGKIEFEEFVKIIQNGFLPGTPSATQEVSKTSTVNTANKPTLHRRESSVSNIKLIFEKFDKDHDGRITKHELGDVMCGLFPDEKITDNDINEMFKVADHDLNGFIDFEEFALMFDLTKLPENKHLMIE